ncbi:alpha/beta fold hydrolase [Pannonibacter sp. Pt2-lr]
MVPRSTAYLQDAAAFRRELKAELASRPPKQRSVMLFIHGYNTLFAEGLYRFTQVVHDAGFPGVPVLFTWASRGDITEYVYDLNSATVARDELQATIEDIAASGATQINILAHSMGTWLLMETMRQMTPAQRGRINQVVLAAPDIDMDVFKDQMQRVGKLKSPLILLLSRDDRALGISQLIAGGKARVGGYEDDAALAKLGAVVVDLTDLKGPDAINHSKFAALAAIAPQLSAVLGQNKLDVPNGDGGALASTGRTLGSFVTGTVNIAVTLPVTLVTTPVEIVTGGR